VVGESDRAGVGLLGRWNGRRGAQGEHGDDGWCSSMPAWGGLASWAYAGLRPAFWGLRPQPPPVGCFAPATYPVGRMASERSGLEVADNGRSPSFEVALVLRATGPTNKEDAHGQIHRDRRSRQKLHEVAVVMLSASERRVPASEPSAPLSSYQSS